MKWLSIILCICELCGVVSYLLRAMEVCGNDQLSRSGYGIELVFSLLSPAVFDDHSATGYLLYGFCVPAWLPPTGPRGCTRSSAVGWAIETYFWEGKRLLGLDDYEERSWQGWHRHMTLLSAPALLPAAGRAGAQNGNLA